MKTNVIKNRRIILGLLKQLERGDCLIRCNSLDLPMRGKLEIEEDQFCSFLTTESLASDDNIQVTFWVNSEYHECNFQRQSDNHYLIPTEITQINRRDKTRIYSNELSSMPVICIVETRLSKHYSFLESVSREAISVLIDLESVNLFIGQMATINVYLCRRTIGAYLVSILKIEKLGNKFKVVAQINQQNIIENERQKFCGIDTKKMDIKLLWPDLEGFACLINVNKISGHGLCGYLDEAIPNIFPIGTIFIEPISGSRVSLVWKDGNHCGFSFDRCSAWEKTNIIRLVVNATQISSQSNRKKASDSLATLTKAGLVKGLRADSYRQESKHEFFLSRSNSSKRWFHVVDNIDNTNLSFLRYSNDGWMVQELASINTEGTTGVDVTFKGIDAFFKECAEDVRPYFSIFGINDAKNPFVRRMWKTIFPKYFINGVFHFDTVIGSIKSMSLDQDSQQGSRCNIVTVNLRNWITYAPNINNMRDRVLYNTFGLNEFEFSCTNLGEILQREKLEYSRVVKVLVDEHNTTLFYLIKLGLPPLSNATSIAENLYIIPASNQSAAYFKEIFRIENDLLNGIEDICILNVYPELKSELSEKLVNFQPREFETGILLVSSFQGFNHE
ncbi:MAG: hypothetical protein A2X86_11890 [Bdellovibrionales bacterium GWA2_49_15]|nr:MAG: hypothetical protein A2X86_11890 [Bdellovibrionales bacterium GWA2_49_15]HAZ12547.1 hypothetical protein [Bdellovibrionales bacterium]